MTQEVVDETYPKLYELLHPFSDADIDKAIQSWNGKIESKHAVVRFMRDHAREKDTAAWLAHEYDGSDGKTRLQSVPEVRSGQSCPGPRSSGGLPSSSKRTVFTPKSNGITWMMWTLFRSGNRWLTEVS